MRNTNVYCDAKAVLSKEVHSTSAIISDSCEIFGQTARLKVSGFLRFEGNFTEWALLIAWQLAWDLNPVKTDDSASASGVHGIGAFEATNLGFGLLNLGDLHESLRFSTQSLPDALENNDHLMELWKSPYQEDEEEYSLCGSDVSSRPYREEIESNLK